MAKKTIKVTNKRTSETAETLVTGNTLILEYEYSDSQAPQQVQFQLLRGKQGDENFTGVQAVGGSLSADGTFSSYTLSTRQRGDGVLLDEIYDICDAILKGTVVKIEESASTGQ